MNITRSFAIVVALLSMLGVADVSSFQKSAPPAPSVVALKTEYAIDPIGIDVRAPRLSWQIQGAARGLMQSSYQIQVASNAAALRSGKGLT